MSQQEKLKNINKAAILAEIQKRAERVQVKKFSIEDYCFKEQIAFIRDPAKFKTAVCSRRAGKSEACAANLVDTCQNTKNATCLYITLSRVSAERIIWRTLLKIIEEHQLKVKIIIKNFQSSF